MVLYRGDILQLDSKTRMCLELKSVLWGRCRMKLFAVWTLTPYIRVVHSYTLLQIHLKKNCFLSYFLAKIKSVKCCAKLECISNANSGSLISISTKQEEKWLGMGQRFFLLCPKLSYINSLMACINSGFTLSEVIYLQPFCPVYNDASVCG